MSEPVVKFYTTMTGGRVWTCHKCRRELLDWESEQDRRYCTSCRLDLKDELQRVVNNDRLAYLLFRAGFYDIREAIAYSDKDLLRVRGFGPESLRQLRAAQGSVSRVEEQLIEHELADMGVIP